MTDLCYPDVREMPTGVLASAIVLAEIILREPSFADPRIAERLVAFKEEWNRRIDGPDDPEMAAGLKLIARA